MSFNGLICNVCRNIVTEDTYTGEFIFKCTTCGEIYESEDQHTLILEENLNTQDQLQKYIERIINSPFDFANERIAITCDNEKCKLPYMTIVKIGKNQNVFYTCTCGNITTPINY